MRYFKCDKSNTHEILELKARCAELTKDEKRFIQKQKRLNTLGTVVFFTVATACVIGCFVLIGLIPEPELGFLSIFYYTFIVIVWLLAIIISGIIGAVIASPIWGKANERHRSMKQTLLSQACEHLREFYELQEPCIVTKCYDASDKRFVMHDVCLFVVGDELRITVNLKHGFFNDENDLGCYAFKRDEISLTAQHGEYIMVELKVEDTMFVLAQRAKRFIEKNFLFKEYRSTTL